MLNTGNSWGLCHSEQQCSLVELDQCLGLYRKSLIFSPEGLQGASDREMRDAHRREHRR